MDKGIINLDSCEISYIQSREDGIPVIFLHENSLAAITFQEVIKSALGEKYRLIAFDFPGHGDSSFSDNPIEDYSLPGMANILKKVSAHLYAENAILVGHGLGGHIILESINDLPWLRAICIFGTPILSTLSQISSAYLPHKGFPKLFGGPFNDKDITLLASAFVKEDYTYGVKQLIKKADYRFRKYYGAWITNGEFVNQKELLRYNQVPMAVFHGNDDELINYDFLKNTKIENLWRNKVNIIKEASHLPQLENPKRFVNLFADFLKYVTG